MNLLRQGIDMYDVLQGFPDLNCRIVMKICSVCKGRSCIVAVHEDMGECPGEMTLPVCPFKPECVSPNWLTLVRMQNSGYYDEEDGDENDN